MRWIRLALVLAALGLAAGEVPAQEPAAGRFITVIGDVQVLSKDGSSRRLGVRGGEIRAGESIATGKDSLAQLRMSDGGALSVRSETKIKLDAYRYSGHKDPGDNFLVSILRGGFRTITGLIARNYRENYRVQTSAMTIGVRGTDFEVVHVVAPTADVVPGTYNRVYAGITTMQGRRGPPVLATRNQTFFIPLAGNLPPAPVLPPASLFGKPTPVPPVAPLSRRDDAPQDDAGKGEGRAIRSLPAVQDKAQDKLQDAAPATAPVKSMTAPLLNPIDTPRVLDTAPALTAPATTLQIAPTTIAPAVKSIDTAPLTTTVAPAVKSIDTTTISPVLTAPTTTISPVLTAPATTTISPILTAPVTTTIAPAVTAPATIVAPVITAPATTIQAPPTMIIKR